jgi:hypothetical protein
MTRRRIWEIGCFPVDAVLCTSFDADELVVIDRGFARAYAIPEHPGVRIPPEILVYGIAHRSCHSENPASLRIERRLDAMHACTILELASMDPVEALAACHAAASENSDDLPGRLWALLTDPRPELRQHDQFWVQGLLIRSLLHWRGSRPACAAEPEGRP